MNPLSWWPLVLAYLIGSISTGVLVSRAFGRDVRDTDFSGASGVARQFGLGIGLLVGALDIFKGAAASWLVRALAPDLAWFAPFAVVVGHNWPVFFGFRGGQGLTPMGGAILALSPWVMLPGIVVGFTAMGLHKLLRLKRFIPLAGQPFGALFALPLTLYLAWRLEGVIWPLVLMTVAMVIRGVQVLSEPKPGSGQGAAEG